MYSKDAKLLCKINYWFFNFFLIPLYYSIIMLIIKSIAEILHVQEFNRSFDDVGHELYKVEELEVDGLYQLPQRRHRLKLKHPKQISFPSPL